MHGRDDKISSCNHNMDLAIGKALVGLMSSDENKHKELRN